MTEKISIVVPVYNVNNYLDRCVDSIVKQKYKNLEIILIDDGSTDGSGSLCDKWKEKDNRIIVVHKVNQGLGYARNTGIDYATGDYITFVDSDDFIDEVMISNMVSSIKEHHADTCYCSLKRYSNEKKVVVLENPIKSGVFDSLSIIRQIIGNEPEEKGDVSKEMSVCASLFSLELIKSNNIRFCSEREYICEDLLFDLNYLPLAKQVVQIEDSYYYYCISDGSLTHRYFPERILKEEKLYEKVKDTLKSLSNNDDLLVRYQRMFLGRVRNCIIQEVKYSNHKFYEKYREIKKICSENSVREVINSYPYYKNPLIQRVFNCCLHNKHILLLIIMAKFR